MAAGSDAVAHGLTREQKLAAASPAPNLFIEAGPGTGKTTVAAHRFGFERFGVASRGDHRAVVAVSFTRAATRTLRRRVQRLWGPSAARWPHRIETLDTMIVGLVHEMLAQGLLVWPKQHLELDVRDSWAAFLSTQRHRTFYDLQLRSNHIQIVVGFRGPRDHVFTYPAQECVPHLEAGRCTHDDIRRTLELAMTVPALADFVRRRLGESLRALIVDEVFDANDLDLTLIRATIDAGVRVTMVGDPWQALYLFRGAKPQAVQHLLTQTGTNIQSLTRSFRWKTDEQERLASYLRDGKPVTLATILPAQVDELKVVLALEWKPLWDLSDAVLPLAFGSFKGTAEEAAATLLLNHMTRTTLGQQATYLSEALTALAIAERGVLSELEGRFQRIVDLLRPAGREAPKNAYVELVRLLKDVTPRELRATNHHYTKRLDLLRIRSRYIGTLIPGLTVHQAKGGEWDAVGLCLKANEQKALDGGLDPQQDLDRKLYVACTRAQRKTVQVLA